MRGCSCVVCTTRTCWPLSASCCHPKGCPVCCCPTCATGTCCSSSAHPSGSVLSGALGLEAWAATGGGDALPSPTDPPVPPEPHCEGPYQLRPASSPRHGVPGGAEVCAQGPGCSELHVRGQGSWGEGRGQGASIYSCPKGASEEIPSSSPCHTALAVSSPLRPVSCLPVSGLQGTLWL